MPFGWLIRATKVETKRWICGTIIEICSLSEIPPTFRSICIDTSNPA